MIRVSLRIRPGSPNRRRLRDGTQTKAASRTYIQR
jgi:hypothetical protein